VTDAPPTWLPAMGCITTARVEALGRAMADTTGVARKGRPYRFVGLIDGRRSETS
jgi:hypothetical protein